MNRLRQVFPFLLVVIIGGCVVLPDLIQSTAVPPTVARLSRIDPDPLPPTSTSASAEAASGVAIGAGAQLRLPQPDDFEATPTFAAFGITQTIGTSASGLPITAYRFGFGADTLILVGGMHGGYEWNTIVLAYQAIDHLQANPDLIPANLTVYVIPSANPDGQQLVTGTAGRFTVDEPYQYTTPGRFNANEVDLNRNWDCDWQAEGSWGRRSVSGGSAPFSEPETQALRRFFWREQPLLVVFWHSQANGVFAAGCLETFPPSLAAAQLFAEAAGYPVYEEFTAYPITGDASNWLAAQNIPSFTVELKTNTGSDWPENQAGIEALLAVYGR